jgi:TonB family protein
MPAKYYTTMEELNCETAKKSRSETNIRDDRRSISTINKAFLTNGSLIDSFINKNDSIINYLKQNDSIRIGLSIPSNGRFGFFWIINNLKLDSVSELSFSKILQKCRLDSIPDFQYTANVQMKIKKENSLNKFILLDTIRFCPIRTKEDIVPVVMKNCKYLKWAYDRRLITKPEMSGKITVKFAIDDAGKIIYIEIVKSNIQDEKFENDIVSIISAWKFCPIDNPGDVTEVIYPFVFSR